MPTFLFIKNRTVCDTLQGANASRLQALVMQHAAASSSAFSGSGHTLNGASTTSARSAEANSFQGIPEGHTSLLHLVDETRSAALNEHPDHRLQAILRDPGSEQHLESDADEELILQVSFKQKVKLSAILLRTAASAVASAPKQVKVFANRPNLGFDDASNEEPAQTLELAESDVVAATDGVAGSKAIPLRFVKFQDVTSIAIAILSNQGGSESTRIDAIDVFGAASETTNMGDLRKLEAQGLDPSLGDGGAPPSRTGLKGGSGRAPSSASASFASQPQPQPQRSPPAQGQPLPSPTSSSAAAGAGATGSRDDAWGTRMRRRSSTASAASYADSATGSVRTAPPGLSPEDEDGGPPADETSPETFGGWHYLPLIIALAPPIGAVIGGRADAWSDAILLFLSSFWLYQFLRVPWDLYYSARTRRVLSHDYAESSDYGGDDDGGAEAEVEPNVSLDVAQGSRQGMPSSPVGGDLASKGADLERERMRQAAAAELRRSELLSLLFCLLSPIIGAYLLTWIRATMADGGRYLNAFNVRLFTLAAGIKPWSHAIKLVRRRILYLQEEVHYPSSKVETLNKQVRRLEADLSSLRKMIATKNDIRILRDVDAQLGRAVRRSEKKEEHLRLSAEDKFHEVESRLEDLLREVAINAELIEEERRERERVTSLRISVVDAFKFLLGAGIIFPRSGSGGAKHYLHDAPRSLPSTASLGIGMCSPTNEQPKTYNGYPLLSRPPLPGQPPQPPPQQQQQQQQQQGSPPRSHAAAATAATSSAGTVPLAPNGVAGAAGQARGSVPGQLGSPPLDHHLVSRYYNRNGVSQGSDAWWEHGLAFYLFLPLSVSSAAIRFASEKVRHILEDSEEYTLRKQRSHYASLGAQHPHQQHHVPPPLSKRPPPIYVPGPKLMKQTGSTASRGRRSDA
ncbi:hypothetical protein ACQY0O_005170 [Thecaphora frezii]